MQMQRSIDRTAAVAIDNMDMHRHVYVYVGPHHTQERDANNIASTRGNWIGIAFRLSASGIRQGNWVVIMKRRGRLERRGEQKRLKFKKPERRGRRG